MTNLKIVLDSVLHFPLSCPNREIIIKDLVLKNPKHKSAKVFAPREADKYPEYDFFYSDSVQHNETIVPLGKKDQLFNYCKTCPHQCPIYDNRFTGFKINEKQQVIDPKIPRPSQSQALSAIKNNIALTGNGLIIMPTGTGKTLLSFMISHMSKKSTLFITHTLDLAEQTMDAYEDIFGVKPGFIGDGKYEINPYFTVAIIDSLYLKKLYHEWSTIFGMVIFDEVHMLPAESCIEVVNSLNIKYKIGLTATPQRSDGRTPVIYGCFGNIVYRISIEEAQKEGSLVPLEARVIETDFQSSFSDERLKARKSLLNAAAKEASQDINRNKIIESRVEEICSYNESILMVLQDIDQCLLMYDLLKDRDGVKPEIFVGKIGKKQIKRKERKKILERAKSGEINVLLTVQLAGMGLDVPRLQHLIIDRNLTSPATVEQIVGRVVRSCSEIGKTHAIVWDVMDKFVPSFVRQTEKRFMVYHKFRKY